MHSQVASEIWDELKRHIASSDRGDLADTVVSILINHDEDPENIRDAFKSDPDIKAALAEYLDNGAAYEEDAEEDDYLDGMEDPDY